MAEQPTLLLQDPTSTPTLTPASNPENLVARAIAPVKPQYLRPPPSRHSDPSQPPDTDPSSAASVLKVKKSKRQLKRERKEEKKSTKNICPAVARTGDVASCRYAGGCRFSHDLAGFLEQKREDLPGTCPFSDDGKACPYGMACRFSGTHTESAAPETLDASKKVSEANGLSKDFQKLLWKNKVKFPKADAQLKLLGLAKGKNFKEKEIEGNSEISNGSNTQEFDAKCAPAKEDVLEDASEVSESRPPKRSKVHDDVKNDAVESNNGSSHEEGIREELMPSEFDNDSNAKNSHVSKIELIPTPHRREKKLIDFRDKLYLAPLTTVGNLPFRRVCKVLGADITCGEMAMCTNLLQGQASEWALLRRHSSEDIFGVQICGAYPDTAARTVELIDRECDIDFIDINMGCPIDIVVNKGAGSSLLTKPMRMKGIIQAACGTFDKPLTVKVRTGYFEGRNRIDSLIADLSLWGATAVTIHGRSRQQRYSKLADWDYINLCARKAPDSIQVLGNGDVFSYHDWSTRKSECPELSTCMIARGALVKPWLFTEIKEERLWDISSAERFDILKKFVHFGLQHWGSDSKGVETTRRFLLEWLSYTCRYIPVGLLDVIPQKLNWRPPSYYGRDDLETLMASDSAADWIKISEMLLGNVPDDFTFTPKHKSNAYERADNG